jgi:hypothetical protein
VPETFRELKNRINKSFKSGASSWFSARNIARCTGNKTLKVGFVSNKDSGLEINSEQIKFVCFNHRILANLQNIKSK